MSFMNVYFLTRAQLLDEFIVAGWPRALVGHAVSVAPRRVTRRQVIISPSGTL